MTETTATPGISVSMRLILMLVRRDGGVTVDECIHRLGRHSIPLGLLLFTLLSTLPLFTIPGFTTITGIPIVLLGAQLALGKEYIWLPRRLRQHRLHSEKLWRAMQRSLPTLRRIERHLTPRLQPFSRIPARNALGMLYVITGTLLALPIPLINFPAGFSMFVLSVGLVARDGVVIAIGVACIALLLAAILLTLGGALSLADHSWLSGAVW